MDKSRPIILKYVCGSESAESAAESAAATSERHGEAAVSALLMEQGAGPLVAFGGDRDGHFMGSAEQTPDRCRVDGTPGLGLGGSLGGCGRRERRGRHQCRAEDKAFHDVFSLKQVDILEFQG